MALLPQSNLAIFDSSNANALSAQTLGQGFAALGSGLTRGFEAQRLQREAQKQRLAESEMQKQKILADDAREAKRQEFEKQKELSRQENEAILASEKAMQEEEFFQIKNKLEQWKVLADGKPLATQLRARAAIFDDEDVGALNDMVGMAEKSEAEQIEMQIAYVDFTADAKNSDELLKKSAEFQKLYPQYQMSKEQTEANSDKFAVWRDKHIAENAAYVRSKEIPKDKAALIESALLVKIDDLNEDARPFVLNGADQIERLRNDRRRPSDETSIVLAGFDQSINDVRSIKAKMKAEPKKWEARGPIKQAIAEFNSKYLGKEDKQTEANAAMKQIILNIYPIAGKSLTDKEIDALSAALIPSLGQDQLRMETVLDNLDRYLTGRRDTIEARLKKSGTIIDMGEQDQLEQDIRDAVELRLKQKDIPLLKSQKTSQVGVTPQGKMVKDANGNWVREQPTKREFKF